MPEQVDDPLVPRSFPRTLRLKVRAESSRWLDAAAVEVNQVWNWANSTSADAADRNRRANAKLLRGFDLCNLSAGATEHFEHIGADTIQRICTEYAAKRKAAKRVKLRWRVSRGTRRSLGWVPFKAANLKHAGRAVRFCGKTFRVFEPERLEGVTWKQGCFAQDAVGDWWLCVPVEVAATDTAAPKEAVGIDLGLKDVAVTSEGERLESSRFFRNLESRIAEAQRRGHKRRAKRLHRKAARCRADALHKFSRKIVDQYQNIFVGDVSSPKLVRTRMAKSVLDSGWGMFRRFLQYKGEHAGRSVKVVSERNTTRECGNCGALTGPTGVEHLVVRRWTCCACGEAHDRDVNAARNILRRAEVSASMRGNESSNSLAPSRQRISRSRDRKETERTAA